MKEDKSCSLVKWNFYCQNPSALNEVSSQDNVLTFLKLVVPDDEFVVAPAVVVLVLVGQDHVNSPDSVAKVQVRIWCGIFK